MIEAEDDGCKGRWGGDGGVSSVGNDRLYAVFSVDTTKSRDCHINDCFVSAGGHPFSVFDWIRKYGVNICCVIMKALKQKRKERNKQTNIQREREKERMKRKKERKTKR